MGAQAKKIMEGMDAIGYDVLLDDWNGYRVYNINLRSRRNGGCFGLPVLILEDNKGNAKRATDEEMFEIAGVINNYKDEE